MATLNILSRPSVAERLVIDHLGHLGDGVAVTSGGAVYVPGALPGETVDVEGAAGHAGRVRLAQIVSASPKRISPACPHFGVCGGCAVQHWDAECYRTWKRSLVVEALERVGLDPPVADLVDAHGAGRRRAVLHARGGAHNVLEVGFSAARAHRVVAIDRCPVFAKSLDSAIEAARQIAEALRPIAKPLDLHVTATDTGLDVDVRGSGSLSAVLVSSLARIANNRDLARLTRHGEIVALRRAPSLRMGKANVQLPPAVFLQATTEGETALARLVLAFCPGADHAADLFAGVGPFALRLAERTRVHAVDHDEQALAALERAASTTSGLKPVTVERRDLFRRPLTAPELKPYDVVVFDPPRQGAESQSRELASSGVPRIVAVSCNPVTFARDASALVHGGYRLSDLTPVDQFRYSAHVEIVALFER
jgi:23S rRNA (uracil1939-C5)-methyltransferase